MDAEVRRYAGIFRRGWQTRDPDWPPRYVPIWSKEPLRAHTGYFSGRAALIGERIRWPLVFLEQACILLLGGGLLTVVIRRERRKAAV